MKDRILKTGVALTGTFLAVSCFLHQARGNGLDFFAYYKAALRFLTGSPFYVFEGVYAFKYGPPAVLYFLPFALLPYSVARWTYAVFHLVVAWVSPYLLWKVLQADRCLKTVSLNTFLAGVLIAALASLRFIDGEFRDSNVGLFMITAILFGCYLLRFSKARFWAPLIAGMGAVVKVHFLISIFALKLSDRKTALAAAVALLLFLLIPGPSYWWDWWRQMQETGATMSLSSTNINLQGFYAFAGRFTSLDPHSHVCLLLALPFFVLALAILPRFSLATAAEAPAVFFLTLGAWALLAVMCSPLPWQHTYSLLWVLIPLTWCAASGKAKAGLLLVAMVLGLSPRDLVGAEVSRFFEENQGVFLTVLGFWFILIFRVRALTKTIDRSGATV